jgi:hypothetical protein
MRALVLSLLFAVLTNSLAIAESFVFLTRQKADDFWRDVRITARAGASIGLLSGDLRPTCEIIAARRRVGISLAISGNVSSFCWTWEPWDRVPISLDAGVEWDRLMVHYRPRLSVSVLSVSW